MIISLGELQSYHSVWRSNNEAGVEQELWEIVSGRVHPKMPHLISFSGMYQKLFILSRNGTNF